jgi:aldehyde:ferredoxin oxidoreductase
MGGGRGPDRMTGGYFGRYLRVDLGTGGATLVPLPEEVLRHYLGGVGLGAWLLLREAPRGVGPLAPEAPLVFSLSPLVGTPLTTSAKFAVVAKSPLTERINDALSSSHFALAAKRAGIDALVIVGACRQPAALVIDGGGAPGAAPTVRLESAADLWGLPAAEAEKRLQDRLRRPRQDAAPARPRESSFHTAAIGPAGENLVRYATLSNDGRHAGRGGIGAVMGAKRLKAIAVRGRRFVPLADPDRVGAAARDLSERSFGPATEKYRELGTAANLLAFNRLAVLPTRNFQESVFEGAEAIAPERLAASRRLTRSSCAACTIGCEHVYGVRRESSATGDAAPAGGERGVRLEYESLFALGPLCGIADPDAVLQAAALCDELGLDTISAGGTIAFAMECAGRGLIASDRYPAPLDPPVHGAAAPGPGVPIAFGSADSLLDLLRRIARREGIGHLLAEGSRRAAAAIGGGAPAFAPHVKGLEIPGYEPRGLQAMALGFAVGSRGADHNRSSAYEVDFSEAGRRLAGDADTARRAVRTEDRAALMDSLILCKFLRGVFQDLFEEAAPLLRAVTGWDVTPAELHDVARRIVTARKWFNEREGWTPAEDTLPERFLSEPLKDGVSAGALLSRARLSEMIVAYNLERGFSPDGRVPESLRHQLGL